MTIDADLPRVGEVLRSKYELLRTLGEGGMSVVYEGRRCGVGNDGERVAVKVLAPEYAHEPEIVARFDREARAVSKLRSRHVVKVLEVDTTDSGLPFIVMDFLDGRDLCAELEERRHLPVDEAVDYLLQTCAAMEEAHRAGIVHRDLKPANLFLANGAPSSSGAPGPRVVKVLDFGISKLVNESSKLTGAGAIMGTVIYMSPEQIYSSTDVDQRADVWSLGVILFELLAGRVPFEGPGHSVAIAIVSDDAPDVRSFAPHVPDALASAIASMLRRDRNTRLKNIREVIGALAPFARPRSVGAEVAKMLLGTTLPTRNASAGRTLPLSRLQHHTMPLSPTYGGARPQPPPSSGPSSSRTPAALASSATPLAAPPNADLDDIVAASERRARAAKTVENRRRSGVSWPAVLAGAALGVVAASIVIGLVLLLASWSAPSRTASTASVRRPPPTIASPPPPPASIMPANEPKPHASPNTPTRITQPAADRDASTTAPAPAPAETHPTLL